MRKILKTKSHLQFTVFFSITRIRYSAYARVFFMSLSLSWQEYFMWLYENKHIITQSTVLVNPTRGYSHNY